MKKRIMFILLIAAMVILLIPSTILRVSATPTSQPIISVENVWAATGSTVEVNVTISGNLGIYGATLTISWAEDLSLIDAESGDVFDGLSYQEPSRYVRSGTNFIWYGTSLREIQDGTALKLTFEVAENVEESSMLEISVSGNGLTDANNSALSASFLSGGVRIVNYIPGDTDGNGEHDPRDLVALAKYISDNCTTDPDGFNVTINVNAADVNDDGELNPMDLVLIAKYISDGCKTDPDGFNVILKPASPKCAHNIQATEAKAATCTEDGNVAYWYCSKCEKYFDDKTGTQEITLAATVISAKGHTEVVDAAKAPTCTETGLTEGKHCSVCGEVIIAQTEIAADGHTEIIDAAKAPTCTETGLSEGKHCSVCGEVIIAQTEIAADGHTEIIDAAKAPTCTETGLSEGKHCSVCGEVIIAQTEIAASGHTEAIDAAKAPTCTETGLTEGKHCSACDEVLIAQTEVAATGHTEVIDPAVAPSCTETGLTEGKHCSVCNEVLIAQTEVATSNHIPCLYDDVHIALTHKNATNYPFTNRDGKWYATNAYATISTYTLTAPADCTVTVECGLSTSCSNDYFNVKHNSTRLVRLTGNKTETRTLELGAGDTLTFEYYKSGYSSTSAWFKIIDAVAKNVETTSVTAHCTQDVICKNCDSVLYSKTGHSPVTDPGRAATCTKTGLTDGQICSVCDEVVATKRVISPTGHSYTNNACTVCDHVLTPSTGLTYSLKDDGTYTITGLGTCTDKTIVIPANINGKDVTSIAGEAFLRKGSFTGLYIPGTVKSIGSSAFEDTYFDFIYMEEGVTSVGSNALSGSYGGNSLIVIPSTLTSIGSQAFMCGADCVVINSQEAASKLTAYDGAGYLLYHSQSALIRSDLSYGSYANQLGSPAVPVEFMGEQYNSFSHNQHSYERCEIMDWSGMRCTSCHMLSDFAEVTLDVSAGDADSVTAHIYSEAGKGIMKLSGYGNISNNIPSTYMYLVEEIIIEEGILSIPDYAFDYYRNLERVTVSSSIASIGSQAFYNSDSLVSIEVSAENQHYTSLDGDLYSKDGTTLIQYAIGKKSEAFNIPQGVVSIGASAFYGCDNLTKVIIPNGVTTIGSSAFSYCTNLSNIEIPSSLTSIGGYAFRGCSKLNQIILPDGMTTIGAYAFYGCTGLESIVLPNTLTSIGSYAFYDCSALADITIPDSVTSIDGFAFAECTSLTSIAIPNSVASMGRYVFSRTTLLVYCEAASKPSGWNTDWSRSDSGGNLWIVWNYGGENGVDENGIKWVLLNTGDIAVCSYDGDKTELTIPTSINGKTVTTIMDKAFYNCKTLKNVILGNTIISIGASAFESCTKLTSITIPDDITYIGGSAFKNCTELKNVNIGTNITGIYEYTFYGCTSLTSIVIPDSVTTIEYYAFKGCTSLTSVAVGKNVTSIGFSAFEGCTALTAIALPDGLESIESSAFEGCTALMTIVIPDSVTSIGSETFFDCTNLSIFCEATQKPTGWSSSWNRKSQAGSSSYYVHSVTWGYTGD